MNVEDNQNVQPDEVREDIHYITGEYLSAAANMVAWQFIEDDAEYETKEDFKLRLTHVFRQHCPVAYSYFFQFSPGEDVLPDGTAQIVLDIIRTKKPTFLGGKISGIILPR